MELNLSVPIFQKNDEGHVVPNVVFHRTHDRLHSRCIEYPFCAAQLEAGDKILDLGSSKSDSRWVEFLDNLGSEVHCSDFDDWAYPTRNIKFFKSDIRRLPFSSNIYDKVVAVSVIEHIGLDNPQVINSVKPEVQYSGDIDAFKEMLRVTKKGGQVIMTFPFGEKEGLISNNEARNYTSESIKKFNDLAEPVLLQYYEYQHNDDCILFREKNSIFLRISRKVRSLFIGSISRKTISGSFCSVAPRGPVTWRCISMANAKAKNKCHIEGILCCVWRKN